MHRLKIVLADADNIYIDRLSDFINSSFPSRIKLVSCTRKVLLDHYLQASLDDFDILLINQEFFDEGSEIYKKIKFKILLTDEKEKSNIAGYDCIYKYQTGESLVKQMLDLYYNSNDVPPLVSGCKTTQIVSVFSPAGGVGKTSVALGLAEHLSQLGKNVFILSFETLNSVSCAFRPSGSDGFTKVLLSLSDNPQLIPARVEMYKSKNQDPQLSYFEPTGCFLEISELAAEDLLLLLAKIKNEGQYDAVVVDLDSAVDRKLVSVLGISDKVVLVHTVDGTGRYKIFTFLDQLRKIELDHCSDILDKLICVVNKYHKNEHVDETYGIKSSCRIPFVQNLWVNGSDGLCQFDPDRQFVANFSDLANLLGFNDGRIPQTEYRYRNYGADSEEKHG